MDAKLKQLIEKDRARVMTDKEKEDQKIGFAYGNAPKNDRHTRETIRDLAESQRGLTKTHDSATRDNQAKTRTV